MSWSSERRAGRPTRLPARWRLRGDAARRAARTIGTGAEGRERPPRGNGDVDADDDEHRLELPPHSDDRERERVSHARGLDLGGHPRNGYGIDGPFAGPLRRLRSPLTTPGGDGRPRDAGLLGDDRIGHLADERCEPLDVRHLATNLRRTASTAATNRLVTLRPKESLVGRQPELPTDRTDRTRTQSGSLGDLAVGDRPHQVQEGRQAILCGGLATPLPSWRRRLAGRPRGAVGRRNGLVRSGTGSARGRSELPGGDLTYGWMLWARRYARTWLTDESVNLATSASGSLPASSERDWTAVMAPLRVEVSVPARIP